MILLRIERYLRAHRMTPTRFGRRALGDPNFVLNLRDGRQPRETTLRRLEAWLEEQERSAQP